MRRPSQRAFQQLDIGLRAYAAFYELEQLAEHVSGCGGEDLGLGTCIRDGLRQRLPVDGARVRVPELGPETSSAPAAMAASMTAPASSRLRRRTVTPL